MQTHVSLGRWLQEEGCTFCTGCGRVSTHMYTPWMLSLQLLHLTATRGVFAEQSAGSSK